ncbi:MULTISPECIES: hypothetical protein [Pseudomonas]|uniref:hypothetical protein n=1 Tax=Pseudomonas TaxID=286 RepID=UPI000A1F4E11|nr:MULTISPECIES: hypothetical protein [Pseudomonas]MDZ5111873.1 hypothetical protein [Pseudomonas putida]
MAKQTINLGTAPSGAGGDDRRSAWVKAIANFDELYTFIATAFNRANIVGSVGQASGVPTGAVMQRGSNSNGEFIRFADGTQICWGMYGMAHNGASLTPTGVTITFPAAFTGFVSTANPKISTQLTLAYPNSNNNFQINRLSGCATSNAGMLIEGAWTPGQTCYIGWTATGRWY